MYIYKYIYREKASLWAVSLDSLLTLYLLLRSSPLLYRKREVKRLASVPDPDSPESLSLSLAPSERLFIFRACMARTGCPYSESLWRASMDRKNSMEIVCRESPPAVHRIFHTDYRRKVD